VVGILLSKVEIAQIVCESISTCPRRASPHAWVSMNEINSSTSQKCEMRDALPGYEGMVRILLSQLEIAQNIYESKSTRPRRAGALV